MLQFVLVKQWFPLCTGCIHLTVWLDFPYVMWLLPVLCVSACIASSHLADKHSVPAPYIFDCKHHHNLQAYCVMRMTASTSLAGRRGGHWGCGPVHAH